MLKIQNNFFYLKKLKWKSSKKTDHIKQTTMNSTLKMIDGIINKYIQFYFNKEEITKDMFDDEECFNEIKFNLGNNWERGYDIVNYLNYRKGKKIDDIMTIYDLTTMIQFVNDYYENNYGSESIMDNKKLTPEFVLRNYVYIYVENYDFECVKEFLVDDDSSTDE